MPRIEYSGLCAISFAIGTGRALCTISHIGATFFQAAMQSCTDKPHPE